MALAARLGPLADASGRQVERNRLRLDASLGQIDSAGAIDVVVHDLSAHGFLAQTSATLPIGSEVWLELAGVGRLSARIRWRGSSTVGCEFDTALAPEVLTAAVNESRVIWPNFPANRSTRPAPENAPRPAASVACVAEESDGRWPFLGRAAFILGSSVLLWSIVILAIRTIWAALA
jgi:PilZ domain-containing protein